MDTPLKRAFDEQGITPTDASKKTGIAQPMIQRWYRGTRDITMEGAVALSPLARVPPEELMFANQRPVNIVGYVAAGRAFFEPANLGLARRPRGMTEDTVAVEIRGDSLGSINDGYIAYFDERREMPTTTRPDRFYVVGLDTGEILVKRLLRRAHHAVNQFDLHGASGDPIPDQTVLWAAKVFAFVPPEDAKIEESQEEQQPVRPQKGAVNRKSKPGGHKRRQR